MAKTTSVLRHDADDRLFDSLRAASRRYHSVALIPAEYVTEARRMQWSWKLIADALRCSPSTVTRHFAKEN